MLVSQRNSCLAKEVFFTPIHVTTLPKCYKSCLEIDQGVQCTRERLDQMIWQKYWFGFPSQLSRSHGLQKTISLVRPFFLSLRKANHTKLKHLILSPSCLENSWHILDVLPGCFIWYLNTYGRAFKPAVPANKNTAPKVPDLRLTLDARKIRNGLKFLSICGVIWKESCRTGSSKS